MREQIEGSFTYFLKVTAMAGEDFWSEEKTFTTECGPTADEFTPKEIDDEITYYVDGNPP